MGYELCVMDSKDDHVSDGAQFEASTAREHFTWSSMTAGELVQRRENSRSLLS